MISMPCPTIASRQSLSPVARLLANSLIFFSVAFKPRSVAISTCQPSCSSTAFSFAASMSVLARFATLSHSYSDTATISALRAAMGFDCTALSAAVSTATTSYSFSSGIPPRMAACDAFHESVSVRCLYLSDSPNWMTRRTSSYRPTTSRSARSAFGMLRSVSHRHVVTSPDSSRQPVCSTLALGTRNHFPCSCSYWPSFCSHAWRTLADVTNSARCFGSFCLRLPQRNGVCTCRMMRRSPSSSSTCAPVAWSLTGVS